MCAYHCYNKCSMWNVKRAIVAASAIATHKWHIEHRCVGGNFNWLHRFPCMFLTSSIVVRLQSNLYFLHGFVRTLYIYVMVLCWKLCNPYDSLNPNHKCLKCVTWKDIMDMNNNCQNLFSFSLASFSLIYLEMKKENVIGKDEVKMLRRERMLIVIEQVIICLRTTTRGAYFLG